MTLISNAAVSRLRKTMAMALALDEEQVTSNLTYQSLTEWDSSAHVGLMLALEAEYGIHVAPTKVMELVSFAAILAFVSPDQPASRAAPTIEIKRGLNGVHFDEHLRNKNSNSSVNWDDLTHTTLHPTHTVC